MIKFNFKKTKDSYLVTNEEILPISYEIKKLYDCKDFLAISGGVLNSQENKDFTFTEDGEYKIIFNEVDIILIKHYEKLLTSIIEGVTHNVCNCQCGCECSEEEDNSLCDLLMLRAKIDVYKRLINPQGVAFFDAINQHTRCLIEKPIYCQVDKEIILGKSECNQKIIKQLIALDYLAIYFYNFKQYCLTEDKEYIRDKFNTKTIFCCIQSLGIDIKSIEKLINEKMGILTINSAAYVNLAPSSVGDYSLNVGNRTVTTLTLPMFTTLTTPAYSDPEGDAPQAVRIDTLPVDGVLKLSGTNVVSGQIIPVVDINLGNLTYESPNQDALDNDEINFSVSDSGSGLFTT